MSYNHGEKKLFSLCTFKWDSSHFNGRIYHANYFLNFSDEKQLISDIRKSISRSAMLEILYMSYDKFNCMKCIYKSILCGQTYAFQEDSCCKV